MILLWLALAAAEQRPPPLSADAAKALAVAEELEAARNFAAARTQLRAVLAHVDAAYRDDLSMRVCMLWQREGREGEARQCLGATRFSDRAHQALSLYHQAVLSEDLQEPVLARAQLRDCIRDYPETHGAERSLVLLRALRREEAGVQAEADLLLGVASELAAVAPKAARLRAAALSEAGRLLLELGKAESARAVLAQARAVGVGTVWRDDAWYWSARAARTLARHDEALAFYRALIEAREAAWVVGSYDSEFLDDSYLELAQLLSHQGHSKEASAVLAEMRSVVPDSRLRMVAEALQRGLDTP